MTTVQTELVRGYAASERKIFASARQYYRCQDCLGVSALEGSRLALETGWGQLGAACGACGGRQEHMGQVGADPHRLVTLTERSVCDERCTNARGPSCECKCGGENHGSRLLVVVTLDAGARPQITPPGEAQKLTLAASDYRGVRDAARARVEGRYGAAMEAKRSGYVDPHTFNLCLTGRRDMEAWHAACAMRSHAARNKALERIGR